MSKSSLKFKVAPHIVEDLGLNLYTSLPRVLVEFVANAYDADATNVEIALDRREITRQRKALRAQFKKDVALATADANTPLATRSLPPGVQISITDDGVGMSREELQEKFLVAGRRRRLAGETHTRGGRVVMGRKGLGKLAGFGVAKTVAVVTKTKEAQRATQILLRYDDLVRSRTTEEVEIPEGEIDAPEIRECGTRIVLSDLLFDPTKSRDTTIENGIADHFALIDQNDFLVSLNNTPIQPTPRVHAYGWPRPDLPVGAFVEHYLALDDRDDDDDEDPSDEAGKRQNPESEDRTVRFLYRIRFTAPGHALHAVERGVRIYANKRLAAAPSLLDADTNMHGFRMADYLDGVVHADFLDEQVIDYIATDRQSLRWDSPELAKLRKFLSDEIREACKQYQFVRDEKSEHEVENDEFTKQEIATLDLTSAERRLARRIAKTLGKAYSDGVKGAGYRATLPALIQAIGRGNILTAITELAEQERPEFARIAVQIARLTKDELENFARQAKARLKAIHALKKVVGDTDFREADNEKDIQTLLEASPWLIDPTFTQFLSADQRLDTMFELLARELKIGEYAKSPVDPEKRPDLVFLLGNSKLGRLVIIELKSANKPLDNSHLDQLELYMHRARRWLKQHHRQMKVEGQLIGMHAPANSKAEKVELLRKHMEEAGPQTDWVVREYLQVLEDTEAAHQELLTAHAKLEAAAT